jgi:hypothetical protein
MILVGFFILTTFLYLRAIRKAMKHYENYESRRKIRNITKSKTSTSGWGGSSD